MRRLSLTLLAIVLSGCAVLRSLGSGQEQPVLRIATYNIRHGAGMDNVVALERTAATLRRLDAEIIGLEEVDENVRRSGSIDEAATLGTLLGMQHAFAEFMDYDGGRYGLALLSRHPIIATERIALPDGPEEPRAALRATIVLPGNDTIDVVVVHFDWLANDAARYRQATTLIGRLTERPRPWIVLGDFNDTPGSRTLRLFRNLVEPAPKLADSSLTFSSTSPTKEIDFIFGSRGDWDVDWVTAITEPMASDHRPVVAAMRRRQ
ncbi:MAG TPA: endonuclease/exonuclease/phosphatase family protein [Gemmatimonadales bacterium]|nr:endonuclease/exonuclease/phosphatase family protein [Gemmatimonadales bacterium]